MNNTDILRHRRCTTRRSITILLRTSAVVLITGCSTQKTDSELAAIGSAHSGGGYASEPVEQPISDFTELGFSLKSDVFNVVPDSASRRVWPSGYQLESATWRGSSGFPRIMINVLDVSKSGESFTEASEMARPMSERISDLLPGELIDMQNTGQLENEYGPSSFQKFKIEARMTCAFVNQFLTNKVQASSSDNYGQIVVEAILCDQNSTDINRPYLERFSNAWRIENSSL